MQLDRVVGRFRVVNSGIRIPKEYKYLFTLMGMPLVDGVFLSVIVSGGLESIGDSLLVGGFVLGGGAMVSVILTEFDNGTHKSLQRTLVSVLVVGVVVIIQSMFAPTLLYIINEEIFKIGAFVALLTVSLQMFPFVKMNYSNYAPLILIAFLILSLEPSGIGSTTAISVSYETIPYAMFAVLTSLLICILAIVMRPFITDLVSDTVLKTATSVGLLFVGFGVIGFVPSVLIPVSFVASALIFSAPSSLTEFT